MLKRWLFRLQPKQWLILGIVLSLLAGSLLGGAWLFYELRQPAPIREAQIIFIPRTASASEISLILKRQHLIRSPLLFVAYVKYKGTERILRAGTFRINPGATLPKIVEALVSENGVAFLIKVTIPEGYCLAEIAACLEKKGLVKQEDFTQFLKTRAPVIFSKRYPFINSAPSGNLEGFLFPDTYFFSRADQAEVIVDAFLKRFQTKIIALGPKNMNQQTAATAFYERMILASIIEKEGRDKAELPYIASVYVNRLKIGMRLQADPTVVYAHGRPWQSAVSYKDLELDSPYNTYQRTGLPPTPIASFGTAAFQAALKPAATPYLFFVADKDGKMHTFSKNYRDHLRAIKAR